MTPPVSELTSKILLGKSGENPAWLDIDELISTRLLIQGNSGSGKSWVIRRLCEQLYGKIPVLIIDPEGEFATLREKFDYVLVGKEGEIQTDVSTAQMVAHRLLEMRLSAVCDIYELRPKERHEWVRLFLEAIIDAPKNLWRPTVIIVDEAHVYSPERGGGESEASEAMKDLATRGRKRGFCGIYATQRIAMLSKTVTAQMLNRLVGMTFEDIDLDRAADLLSIPRSERIEFNKQMKIIDRGYFYGLGRAISKERIMIRIGTVQTSHPKPGSVSYGAAPPPTPEKIKLLLSKLSDIPQVVAERALTETELRMEIKDLRTRLATAEKKPAEVVIQHDEPVIETKIQVEEIRVPTVKESDLKRIEKTLDRAQKLIEKTTELGEPFLKAATTLKESLDSLLAIDGEKMVALRTAELLEEQKAKAVPASPAVRPARTPVVPVSPQQPEGEVDSADVELTNPRLTILRALRELMHIDIDVPSREQLAGWLGIKVTGSFRNNLGALRSGNYINYEGDGVLLTKDGLRAAPPPAVEVTHKAIFDHVLRAVTGPQGEILKIAHGRHPNWLTREELAATLGIAVTGSYRNNLGRLHTAKMLDYGSGEKKNCVKCADWMFVGGVMTT